MVFFAFSLCNNTYITHSAQRASGQTSQRCPFRHRLHPVLDALSRESRVVSPLQPLGFSSLVFSPVLLPLLSSTSSLSPFLLANSASLPTSSPIPSSLETTILTTLIRIGFTRWIIFSFPLLFLAARSLLSYHVSSPCLILPPGCVDALATPRLTVSEFLRQQGACFFSGVITGY